MTAKEQMYNRILHHNMAVVGGFLAGYTVLLKGHLIGNAQTANLIFMIFNMVKNQPFQSLLRLLGLCLYMTGGMAFVFIKNKTKLDVKAVSLAITFLMILVIGLLPEDTDIVIGLFPIFFAMSFQWNAFPGEYGYGSSTIFSSNNVRQVSLSIGEILFPERALSKEDKRLYNKQHIHKAVFFLGSLLGFHMGVALAYFAVQLFYEKAVWFDWIFIATGIILLIKTKTVSGSK